MKELRAHQAKAIDLLRQSLRSGKKRPVLALSTGAGKTVIAANIIRMARDKGKRIAFIVDAISLIDQTMAAFYAEGLHSIGVIQADHPAQNWSQPIQICSVQTLQRREMPNVDMVIVDECHAKSAWLFDWMGANPKVVVIGLSATPWARGLGNVYDDLIQPVTMQELIDQGYLCPFRVFAASKPDLSKVKTIAGEYHEGQLSDVMAEDGLVADVVETWIASSEGRPTLVFAVDCAHAQKLQERFAAADVPMGYVDAYTERLDRKRLAEQLEAKVINGIVSVGTMVKGVDLPFVTCISDCAPTKSEMRHVQKLGRGMRIDPNGTPDLIILDHASNCLRLGFPTDIHHNKLCTKKPGEKSDTDSEDAPPPKPKECPQCKQLRPKGVKTCPSCGFEAKPFSDIKEKEGQLKEVKRVDPAERDRFYAEAIFYARTKGKNEGWAWHLTRNRFGTAPRQKPEAIRTSPSTIAYITAQNIRRAKGQAKHARS